MMDKSLEDMLKSHLVVSNELAKINEKLAVTTNQTLTENDTENLINTITALRIELMRISKELIETMATENVKNQDMETVNQLIENIHKDHQTSLDIIKYQNSIEGKVLKIIKRNKRSFFFWFNIDKNDKNE